MSEPVSDMDELNALNRNRIVREVKRILIAEAAKRDGKIDFDAMAAAVADHDFRPQVILQ